MSTNPLQQIAADTIVDLAEAAALLRDNLPGLMQEEDMPLIGRALNVMGRAQAFLEVFAALRTTDGPDLRTADNTKGPTT